MYLDDPQTISDVIRPHPGDSPTMICDSPIIPNGAQAIPSYSYTYSAGTGPHYLSIQQCHSSIQT